MMGYEGSGVSSARHWASVFTTLSFLAMGFVLGREARVEACSGRPPPRHPPSHRAAPTTAKAHKRACFVPPIIPCSPAAPWTCLLFPVRTSAPWGSPRRERIVPSSCSRPMPRTRGVEDPAGTPAAGAGAIGLRARRALVGSHVASGRRCSPPRTCGRCCSGGSRRSWRRCGGGGRSSCC